MPEESPSGGRAALLLGATGLVGGYCLDLLLADPLYSKVVVVARRPLMRADPKLVVIVTDFDDLDRHEDGFAVDDVFCCLGTTIRKAGSREAFRQVDVEYPVAAGRLAAARGARRFVIVTALGADPASRIAYNRDKGEVEERVKGLPLEAVWIFRPSLLLGSRSEVRVGERIAQLLLRPLAPVFAGPLRRYRPVHAARVAAAMVAAARKEGPGRVVESEEIPRLAATLSPPPHRRSSS
jgi:uncharacterized protein YbjT (DUF2867 family)